MTEGIQLLLLYQREKFDYRIAGIHGQLCETARPGSALDSRPLPGIWTRLADMPTSRSEVAAAVLDSKIYTIGGRDSTQDLNSVEVYDPTNDPWETLEGLPTARDHLAAAVVREKIYATGGRLTSYAHNLTVTENYDPNLDRWTLAEPLPIARSGIGAATVLGKLYVFGGEATEGTYEENESYDPASNLWETGPPMPTARHGIGVVNLGNRIYVLAGGTSPGGSASALNEAFIVLSGLIVDDSMDDKVGHEEDSDDGGY